VRSHAWIDRRSLALHEAVASKLDERPELVEHARTNLARWLANGPSAALEEWRDLLERATLGELTALLRSPDESATRLRQSNPFAGVLSPEERQAILDRHERAPPGRAGACETPDGREKPRITGVNAGSGAGNLRRLALLQLESTLR
jgi:hypothetical protein